MRKVLILIACILSIIVPYSAYAASREYYVEKADAVLRLDDDWIYITKDTNPSEIELSGTPFNYEGMSGIIRQTIDYLNAPEYSDVHCIAMSGTMHSGLVEIQLATKKDENSQSLWDISLLPHAEDEFKRAGALEVYTNERDTWVQLDVPNAEKGSMTYITYNNGRCVTMHFSTFYIDDRSEQTRIAHDLIDRVRFTQKGPETCC